MIRSMACTIRRIPQAKSDELAHQTPFCVNKPHIACPNENNEPFLMNNPIFNFAVVQTYSNNKGDAELFYNSPP